MSYPETVQIVSAVIAQPDSSSVLLLRHHDRSNEWDLPGGKVKPGEAAEEAAKRELYEDLGVEAAIGQLLVRTTFKESGVVYDCQAFHADVLHGMPAVKEKELYDDLRYVDLARRGIGSLGLSSSVEKLVWLVQNDEVKL